MLAIINENNNFECKGGDEIELDITDLDRKTLRMLKKFVDAYKAKVNSESPDSRVFVNKVGSVYTGSCSPAGRVGCSERAVLHLLSQTGGSA